eukprot:scaffold72716_cov53-Phaeocystis_antarctica.AAC.4
METAAWAGPESSSAAEQQSETITASPTWSSARAGAGLAARGPRCNAVVDAVKRSVARPRMPSPCLCCVGLRRPVARWCPPRHQGGEKHVRPLVDRKNL